MGQRCGVARDVRVDIVEAQVSEDREGRALSLNELLNPGPRNGLIFNLCFADHPYDHQPFVFKCLPVFFFRDTRETFAGPSPAGGENKPDGLIFIATRGVQVEVLFLTVDVAFEAEVGDVVAFILTLFGRIKGTALRSVDPILSVWIHLFDVRRGSVVFGYIVSGVFSPGGAAEHTHNARN